MRDYDGRILVMEANGEWWLVDNRPMSNGADLFMGDRKPAERDVWRRIEEEGIE